MIAPQPYYRRLTFLCLLGAAILIWASIVASIVAAVVLAVAVGHLGGSGGHGIYTDPSGHQCPSGWQTSNGYCP